MSYHESLRQALLAPINKTKTRSGCLSTGSILLDRMLSVESECAIRKGDVLWFHGTSGSCRTFLAHQILAEAANNRYFSDYLLFYDNPASTRPISDFGQKYRARVTQVASQSVAEWFDRLEGVGGRCMYVLDSLNALCGDPVENVRLIDQKIRGICKEITRNQSILLFISDNINSFTPDTTRTLRDVPDIILYFTQPSQKQSQRYAVTTAVRIIVQKRPTLSTCPHEHVFTFIPDYGIDDAQACFDFLIRRHLITQESPISFTLSRLGMQNFTFDEFVDEFDSIKSLLKPLLT